MSGVGASRRCLGLNRRGERCRAPAMRDSDYCVAHQRQGARGEGNPAPSDLGFYILPAKELRTLEDVIEDMLQRQSQLTALIEEKSLAENGGISELAKLLALHGQNASR